MGDLSDAEQADVGVVVDLLEIRGPHLPFPHSPAVHGWKHGHMRELRIRHRGRPYRVLYDEHLEELRREAQRNAEPKCND